MKGVDAVPGAPFGPEQEALAPMRKKTQRTKSAHAGGKQYGSERSHPQPEERPILDECVPGLLFDSLASVQAAIVSASKKVPHRTLRQAMAIDEQEKRELTRAAQAVAAKHAAFFSKHRDALEFVTVLTAINAAQMDHMLSLIDQSDGPPAPAESGPSGEHVCSAREALVIAFIVLAPLALLALILILERRRK